MWNQYYGIIKVANAALESLDSYAENITSDDDMTNYRSYCGEVRSFVLMLITGLYRLFGPVTICVIILNRHDPFNDQCCI